MKMQYLFIVFFLTVISNLSAQTVSFMNFTSGPIEVTKIRTADGRVTYLPYQIILNPGEIHSTDKSHTGYQVGIPDNKASAQLIPQTMLDPYTTECQSVMVDVIRGHARNTINMSIKCLGRELGG